MGGGRSDMAADTDVIITKMEHMQDDLAEIKTIAKCNEKRGLEFEKHYIKEHNLVVQSCNSAHTRLDDYERRLTKIEDTIAELADAVKPLLYQSRVLIWLAAGFGTLILGLVFMIFTGQVVLSFR